MEARTTADRGPASATVIVVGGDAVVGQALELLLRGADYGVRFLPERSLIRVPPAGGALDGARLLLLAPKLSAEGREGVLAWVRASSAAKKIPVLELVDDPDGARDGSGRCFLPWPCRTEDLKRHIDAALTGREVVGS